MISSIPSAGRCPTVPIYAICVGRNIALRDPKTLKDDAEKVADISFMERLNNSLILIGVEHPLDLVGVLGLGKRQGQQDTGLPGLEIVACDEAAAR